LNQGLFNIVHDLRYRASGHIVSVAQIKLHRRLILRQQTSLPSRIPVGVFAATVRRVKRVKDDD